MEFVKSKRSFTHASSLRDEAEAAEQLIDLLGSVTAETYLALAVLHCDMRISYTKSFNDNAETFKGAENYLSGLSLSPYPRNFTQWQIKEWKREELTFLCDVFTLSGHRSFEHDCGICINFIQIRTIIGSRNKMESGTESSTESEPRRN
ncbi:hypothetical protein EVAR_38261_1 [Eumeta japonica]|uniref:Uncharacterized protein n=1 Tax=Eumeta variegata TaxID=151549 RepID=A0A4C1Y7P5_EUMVA|nr:hypothetical protein EVAR_38261_1 [Eumeta japonica]